MRLGYFEIGGSFISIFYFWSRKKEILIYDMSSESGSLYLNCSIGIFATYQHKWEETIYDCIFYIYFAAHFALS